MATTAAPESENLPARPKIGGDFLEGLSSLNLLRQVGLMITLAASVAVRKGLVVATAEKINPN